MIVDLTYSAIERKIEERVKELFVSWCPPDHLVPHFGRSLDDSDEDYIIQRRFRDCIYCLQRTEHPEPCKYTARWFRNKHGVTFGHLWSNKIHISSKIDRG